MSLAQGIVYWTPPQLALEDTLRAASMKSEALHGYAPDEGLASLREALRNKCRDENGLPGVDVVVTAGANQGFASIVMTCCDVGDRAVVFTPYYFNHVMALQVRCGGRKGSGRTSVGCVDLGVDWGWGWSYEG